jgi:hypothetical protein
MKALQRSSFHEIDKNPSPSSSSFFWIRWRKNSLSDVGPGLFLRLVPREAFLKKTARQKL